MKDAIFESLAKVWGSFSSKMLHLLPRILAALVVVAVGWVVAVLIRAGLQRGLRMAHFDERCERSGMTLLLRRAEVRWTPTEVIGKVAYWGILLSAAIFSLSAMEMPVLDRMVEAFFLYLPKTFVALVILALGFLLSNFLSRAALLLSVNEELPAPRAVGGTVRLLVNGLAFAMAMEQLGIARNTVTVAFAIAFGALMLGLALAFGLGGKDLARDFLARRIKARESAEAEELRHL